MHFGIQLKWNGPHGLVNYLSNNYMKDIFQKIIFLDVNGRLGY